MHDYTWVCECVGGWGGGVSISALAKPIVFSFNSSAGGHVIGSPG